MQQRTSIFRTILLTLFGAALVGCTKQEGAEEAEIFKDDLIHSMRKARSISIVEHSCIYDFSHEDGSLPENPPHIEYKRLELNQKQHEDLLIAFETMSDAPKTVFTLCLFEPHHSIELSYDDGTKNAVQICFKCGDTEWEGIAPKEFQPIFKRFVEPLGFQTNRNWRQPSQASSEPPCSCLYF